MSTASLYQPWRLNSTLTLANRVVMAPLTRSQAGPGLMPTEAMAAYYARRADAGLIISEATLIRADGQGYPDTPGLYTAEQVAGWQEVTRRVHQAGGTIVAQLWHTGRASHEYFHGQTPVAPSAIGLEGTLPRMRGLAYPVPRALETAEIAQLVADYAQAAANAREAGFDGVEIHGANGYLIDQFLHHASNRREDAYGGSPENMARFALEVVDAVAARIGAERVGIRLSPGAYFNMEPDTRDRAVFDHLLAELELRGLAYVHGGIFDDSLRFDYLDGTISEYLRRHYRGTLIASGSYTAESAAAAIDAGRFELVAIGRPFIANPDYVSRVREGLPLVDYVDSMLASLV
ncbi:MAG: alkene reductase [Gammaproteobacteria bacterium]|nr:alkene reductase [Gammaproteobacteria bacterium]